jgi:hypothetical protein
MRTTLAILLLLLATPAFAFGRRPVYNTTYYPTYYYAPRVVIQEKYSIPIRELKYAEVAGLKIIEDSDGVQYMIVNGNPIKLSSKVIENISEKRQDNKIIIERTITQ